METIFDLKATQKELASFEADYSLMSREDYLQDLSKRAEHFKSTTEYEAVCDLQHLSKLRDDQEGFKKYTQILDIDFSYITNRIFNE